VVASIDAGWPLSDEVSRAFAARVLPALSDCDAVILSDYGSGLITPSLRLRDSTGTGNEPAAGPCRRPSTALPDA
jgi:bifunctional ADP-heptose synthase (sugar kinase/adenylyltransferase)